MTEHAHPIRVLIADDHPVVRAGYRRLMEAGGEIQVVAEAGDGQEASRLYFELRPDVLVLDLSMPGGGGLEALRRVRAKDPAARVLVFSMHKSRVMMQRALEAGALCYLTKDSAAGRMIEAVQHAARGEAFIDPLLSDPADVGDPLSVLTPREFQIFRLLAEGQTTGQIAETLCISRKTSNVHQTNIFRKLQLTNSAQLSRLAIRCGVIDP